MKLKWICFGIAFIALGCAEIRAQAVSGLAATRVASGLSRPLFVTAPPGDFNRLFIVQQTGQVLILNLQTGKINPTPFLDIGARLTDTSGEQGLLGMAFDPNYSRNGKFYLDFTVPGGAFGNGRTHVSQFSVIPKQPDIATTSNERVLLTFDHPENNHNGGWIGFSPRAGDANNLYIATGDGGNGNDQGNGHIEPGGNSQNNTTLLGKMLRVHVNANGGVSIPSNNPFSRSKTFRKEIWAFGLRNPFRDSFDRQTGNMLIGDVGQDTREEVDVQPATNSGGGENYEWRLREGTISTPTGNPTVGGARPTGGTDPIFDYPHSTGQTVIGGYVYRGSQIPALRGTYVFADFLGPEPGFTGKIFTLNYDGASASNFQDITSELFPTSDGATLNNPSSLGEDTNGELYITDIGSGSVFKIVLATATSARIDRVTTLPAGRVLVQGSGAPFATYTIEATANRVPPFVPIGTVTADGDGKFRFEDANAAFFPGRIYQGTKP